MEIKDETVMMKDGRMRVIKDGEMRDMEKEITMPNGTRVMPDGTVMMTNGTSRELGEGEGVILDGRVVNMDTLEDRESRGDLP